MIKRIVLVFLCANAFVFAQGDLNNFSGLKAGGDVPEDFTKLSSEKYRDDLAANRDDNLDKDFFLSTRFFIDDLLLSGKMLFNEPLSNYLNKVARYTLRREKKLYDELRFYVLRSNSVNAFSTDQGIIVFTTGLLAQLENEAQLAYIIAHEVSHFTEKHVRESYAEKQNLSKGKGKYSRMSYESRISELSIYQKDNELEADKRGIEIFLTTEYARDEIFSSFEMLLYSYLPFDDVKFDTAFFNTPVMTVPGVFFPDTINSITREEDYDDRNSTHPNIKKRMDAAFDMVGDKKSMGELKFKISESEFYNVRTLARFESVNLAIKERDYGDALYQIFLLRKDHPNNQYLDLAFVQSLYGLAKYKNGNRFSEVTEKPKNVEGESYKLHFFLKELSDEQMTVIALRHAYDYAAKYPTNTDFRKYKTDLITELGAKTNLSISDLKDRPYEEFIDEVEEELKTFDVEDSIRKIDASDISKYEKIRLKKKLRNMSNEVETVNGFEADFHLYALHDLIKIGFAKELETAKENYQIEQEERERLAADRRENNEKERIGAQKVVIVDPIFETYSVRNKRKHTKSEDKKLSLGSVYDAEYSKLNIKTQVVDSKNLNQNSVDIYNNLGTIFEWVAEVLEHDDLNMISSSNSQMQTLRKSYGTDHFLFSGIYAYKERHEFSAAHLYGILFVYTIPIVVADLLVIHNYFEMVAFSVNAEDDRVEFVTVNDVNLRSTNQVIQAYVYDILYSLSQTK